MPTAASAQLSCSSGCQARGAHGGSAQGRVYPAARLGAPPGMRPGGVRGAGRGGAQRSWGAGHRQGRGRPRRMEARRARAGAGAGASPSSSSLTSRAAFSPSSRRFLSIILDRSAAALSSALTVQPMAPQGWAGLGPGPGVRQRGRSAARRSPSLRLPAGSEPLAAGRAGRGGRRPKLLSQRRAPPVGGPRPGAAPRRRRAPATRPACRAGGRPARSRAPRTGGSWGRGRSSPTGLPRAAGKRRLPGPRPTRRPGPWCAAGAGSRKQSRGSGGGRALAQRVGPRSPASKVGPKHQSLAAVPQGQPGALRECHIHSLPCPPTPCASCCSAPCSTACHTRRLPMTLVAHATGWLPGSSQSRHSSGQITCPVSDTLHTSYLLKRCRCCIPDANQRCSSVHLA